MFEHASRNPACLLMLVQNGAIPHTKPGMEVVDKLITLELARELREDIVSSIRGHDQGNIIPCGSQRQIGASRKRRQQAHCVLLQFRERKFHQHGTVMVWTSGALHLIEESLIGQLPDHGMIEAYLHLQLLYSNLQQQTSWRETSNTVLLLKEKDGQFCLQT